MRGSQLPRPAVLTLALTVLWSCGDSGPSEPVEIFPDVNGTWQFRSAVSQGNIVCIERGDVTLAQGANVPAFQGEAVLIMECWQDIKLIRSDTDTIPVTGGLFQSETPRNSWPVTFSMRPGWTYEGEAFYAAGGSFVIQGHGTASLDPGNGSTLTDQAEWTLCKEFVDQADFVERVCR
ncbi:MAG: hypothetical protein ACE5GJ_00395 [Gemmatimonadota bacterium]